jgi:hypothetical protein
MGIKLSNIWKFCQVAFIILAIGLSGCSTSPGAQNNVSKKAGAQLWGESCIRCHNAPSPSAFRDEEWEAATLHMRVRANLTADETEKILDFLKLANGR